MIKLKSYLNLWPEHYQGLQEERFNRQREREERAMLALLPIPKIDSLGMNACNVGGKCLILAKNSPQSDPAESNSLNGETHQQTKTAPD